MLAHLAPPVIARCVPPGPLPDNVVVAIPICILLWSCSASWMVGCACRGGLVITVLTCDAVLPVHSPRPRCSLPAWPTAFKVYKVAVCCSGLVDLGTLAGRAGFKQQSLELLCALLLGHTFEQAPVSSENVIDGLCIPADQLRRWGTRAWVSREVAVKLAPLWLPV